jgi:hypothetical protein
MPLKGPEWEVLREIHMKMGALCASARRCTVQHSTFVVCSYKMWLRVWIFSIALLCPSDFALAMLIHKMRLLMIQMCSAYQHWFSHLMRMFLNSSRPSCRRRHLRGGSRQTAQPFWYSFDDVPNCPPPSTSTQPSARLMYCMMRGWKLNELLNLDLGIPVSAKWPGTIPVWNVKIWGRHDRECLGCGDSCVTTTT